MVPPARLRVITVSFRGIAFALCASSISGGPIDAQTQPSLSQTATVGSHSSESLKGKSNEELVHLLVDGKSVQRLEAEVRRANEVKTHLPEHFWEMPPRDAALALVQDNCNLKLKTQLKISMRGENRQPPDKGRVHLRLELTHYNIPREALLELSSDGMTSTLRFSNVELLGPVNRSVVERAIRRTTRCGLPEEEARRLYEIIWWLGQVQFSRPEQETAATERIFSTQRIISSHSVNGKLSVQPDGPKQEITLCPAPLSECYYETFDDDLYASFVSFLFRETLNRHGVDLDDPTAVLGEETYSSAEEKFVFTSKPPPPNDPATAKWIGRMLRNLERYRSSVISELVSFEEPLRYSDSRIDDALFHLLRSGLSARALNRKTGEAEFGDAARAGHALAWRKRQDAFPLIMELLSAGNDDRRYAKEELLKAATLLASTKPESPQKLVEYLTTQLNDIAKSSHFTSVLFDSVWRADLREMTPLLEKMATASPGEIEDERGSSWISPPRPVVGRFHGARRILTAWRESDPLTKVKLDAIIEASTAFGGGPAEFLRHEFAALPEDEQRKFKEFVQWLDKYRPNEGETSWSTGSLLTVFVGPS